MPEPTQALRIPSRIDFLRGGEGLRQALTSAPRTRPIEAEDVGLGYPLALIFLLVSILLIPASVTVHLSGDGLKFTAGRAAVMALLLPAVMKLLDGSRRPILSDLLIVLTSAWMIGSRYGEDGLNSSALAEVIEINGAYIVARAYLYNLAALRVFIGALKCAMLFLVTLAIADVVAGLNIATFVTSFIFGTPYFAPQIRYGLARAQSTIEDAEHWGTVCLVAGCILLRVEKTLLPRVFWTGICFLGCILAISSGPLVAFALAIGAFIYDRAAKGITWRWKILGLTVFAIVGVFSCTASRPTSWLISHMTLDPSTGYFRQYVFDYVLDEIAERPYTGWGFGSVGSDDFLSNVTVDNVWLVLAARFGIGAPILLFMTNILAFFPLVKKKHIADLNRYSTAFTFALVSIICVGFTVHYWNAVWMLWGLCLGARASLKERQGKPTCGVGR